MVLDHISVLSDCHQNFKNYKLITRYVIVTKYLCYEAALETNGLIYHQIPELVVNWIGHWRARYVASCLTTLIEGLIVLRFLDERQSSKVGTTSYSYIDMHKEQHETVYGKYYSNQ